MKIKLKELIKIIRESLDEMAMGDFRAFPAADE